MILHQKYQISSRHQLTWVVLLVHPFSGDIQKRQHIKLSMIHCQKSLLTVFHSYLIIKPPVVKVNKNLPTPLWIIHQRNIIRLIKTKNKMLYVFSSFSCFDLRNLKSQIVSFSSCIQSQNNCHAVFLDIIVSKKAMRRRRICASRVDFLPLLVDAGVRYANRGFLRCVSAWCYAGQMTDVKDYVIWTMHVYAENYEVFC